VQCPAVKGGCGDSKRAFLSRFHLDAKTKKNTFFEKEAEKWLKTRARGKNEPKREPENLLKALPRPKG
jgi:hypothetical protein